MGGGIQWTPSMERALVDALLTQHRRGKRADGGWKSEAWQAILPLVQAQITQENSEGSRVIITKQQLSNKTTDLKQTYSAWKGCFNLSGFGWDDDTQLFVAADDVWENYIKANPKAKRIRYKPLAHREILDELFSDVSATGRFARSATVTLASIEQEQDNNSNIDPTLLSWPTTRSSSPQNLENDSAGQREDTAQSLAPKENLRQHKRKATENGKGIEKKRRRQTGGKSLAEALNGLTNSLIASIAERREEGKTDLKRCLELLNREYTNEGSTFIYQASLALRKEDNATIWISILNTEVRKVILETMMIG